MPEFFSKKMEEHDGEFEAFINAGGFRESSRDTKRFENAAAGFDVGEEGVIAKTRTWTSWTILTTSWSHSETDNHQQ